jgi:hypothetical protein
MQLDQIVRKMSDRELQIWLDSCRVNPDLTESVKLALHRERRRRKRTRQAEPAYATG